MVFESAVSFTNKHTISCPEAYEALFAVRRSVVYSIWICKSFSSLNFSTATSKLSTTHEVESYDNILTRFFSSSPAEKLSFPIALRRPRTDLVSIRTRFAMAAITTMQYSGFDTTDRNLSPGSSQTLHGPEAEMVAKARHPASKLWYTPVGEVPDKISSTTIDFSLICSNPTSSFRISAFSSSGTLSLLRISLPVSTTTMLAMSSPSLTNMWPSSTSIGIMNFETSTNKSRGSSLAAWLLFFWRTSSADAILFALVCGIFLVAKYCLDCECCEVCDCVGLRNQYQWL
mmetsp:Transcript_16943/g.34871  ORF Transcript_16943/g.34871 Transcript_16943/m.34871 type:complete len:287 (+) Transcript_16943:1020-1880(+)